MINTLYANYNNDKITLTNQINNLATCDEIMDFICVGEIEELPRHTILKDGMLVYYSDTNELDVIKC